MQVRAAWSKAAGFKNVAVSVFLVIFHTYRCGYFHTKRISGNGLCRPKTDAADLYANGENDSKFLVVLVILHGGYPGHPTY